MERGGSRGCSGEWWDNKVLLGAEGVVESDESKEWWDNKQSKWAGEQL